MAAEKERIDLSAIAPDSSAAQLILGGRGVLYPIEQVQYWREAYEVEPYFRQGLNFEDYAPAYELGWTGYSLYGGEFDTADRVLANDWAVQKGVSRLAWDEARPACRAAWQRAHNASSYVSDGSGAGGAAVEALQELLANARDSDLGFTEAAQHTETAALRSFLERRAQACRDVAHELQQQITLLGGQAQESGTVTGAAHRAWLQIRGLFGGAGDDVILGECERAEAAALASMAQALRQNLPADVHAIVLRQFECTQRNHDKVRSMRASAAAAAEDRSGQAA